MTYIRHFKVFRQPCSYRCCGISDAKASAAARLNKFWHMQPLITSLEWRKFEPEVLLNNHWRFSVVIFRGFLLLLEMNTRQGISLRWVVGIVYDGVRWMLTRKAYLVGWTYRQIFNTRCTLIGYEIVDHSDVVGASPVGAAPTTHLYSRLNTWLQ